MQGIGEAAGLSGAAQATLRTPQRKPDQRFVMGARSGGGRARPRSSAGLSDEKQPKRLSPNDQARADRRQRKLERIADLKIETELAQRQMARALQPQQHELDAAQLRHQIDAVQQADVGRLYEAAKLDPAFAGTLADKMPWLGGKGTRNTIAKWEKGKDGDRVLAFYTGAGGGPLVHDGHPVRFSEAALKAQYGKPGKWTAAKSGDYLVDQNSGTVRGVPPGLRSVDWKPIEQTDDLTNAKTITGFYDARDPAKQLDASGRPAGAGGPRPVAPRSAKDLPRYLEEYQQAARAKGIPEERIAQALEQIRARYAPAAGGSPAPASSGAAAPAAPASPGLGDADQPPAALPTIDAASASNARAAAQDRAAQIAAARGSYRAKVEGERQRLASTSLGRTFREVEGIVDRETNNSYRGQPSVDELERAHQRLAAIYGELSPAQKRMALELNDRIAELANRGGNGAGGAGLSSVPDGRGNPGIAR